MMERGATATRSCVRKAASVAIGAAFLRGEIAAEWGRHEREGSGCGAE